MSCVVLQSQNKIYIRVAKLFLRRLVKLRMVGCGKLIGSKKFKLYKQYDTTKNTKSKGPPDFIGKGIKPPGRNAPFIPTWICPGQRSCAQNPFLLGFKLHESDTLSL